MNSSPFYEENDILIDDLEIAIITLTQSEDRRALINFSPNSWVMGYDGKNLDTNYLQNELIRYTDKIFLVPYNHPITPIWKARIGCFLSHMKALTQFSKPLLILEDDFKTTGNLKERLLKDVPNDYDILFLGGFFQVKKGKEFNPKLGWNKIDTNLIKYYTTHSYIVRDPKALLKMIKTNGKRPTTLDIYYNRNVFPKLNVYFHFNSIVTQNINLESLIDPSLKYNNLKK